MNTNVISLEHRLSQSKNKDRFKTEPLIMNRYTKCYELLKPFVASVLLIILDLVLGLPALADDTDVLKGRRSQRKRKIRLCKYNVGLPICGFSHLTMARYLLKISRLFGKFHFLAALMC